jgi:periplasmic divalent cation tolerance protein
VQDVTHDDGMSDELRIGLTTCDNADVAERIAIELVERGLAACVKLDPNVRSIYRFNGELQDHSEIRLMVKFAARNGPAIESFIKVNLTYEIPEWIVIRPESVCQKYLDWATQ